MARGRGKRGKRQRARRVPWRFVGAVALIAGAWALLHWLLGPGRATLANVLFALGVGAVVLLAVWLWRRKRARRRIRARTLAEMRALTPAQFEEAVATLLRDLGYRDVRRVGGAGDLAADVVCTDDLGQSVVVQCKRYAEGRLIDSPTMQTFIGMAVVHHRADRGMFVTTSGFTAPAAALGREHGIDLIAADALAHLLTTARERSARTRRTRRFGDRLRSLSRRVASDE